MSTLRFFALRPCVRVLLATLAFLPLAPSALAQPNFHQTTLSLQEPVVNVSSVTRVVYIWSTLETFGLVTEFDLEDLTLQLHGPDGLVYADHVVVDGVTQPFAGLPRSIGDIFWEFDFPSATLEQMRNTSVELVEASTGLQFHVLDSISIPDDGFVSVKAYLDGVNQDPHTDQLDVQATIPMLFYSSFETGDFSEWAVVSP